MPLSSKQRGVTHGAASAAVISLALLWMAVHFNPFEFAEPLAIQQRLSIALNADLLVMLCLAVAIARVANHRFFTLEDIDGAGLTPGTDRAKLLQALCRTRLNRSCLPACSTLPRQSCCPRRGFRLLWLQACHS